MRLSCDYYIKYSSKTLKKCSLAEATTAVHSYYIVVSTFHPCCRHGARSHATRRRWPPRSPPPGNGPAAWAECTRPRSRGGRSDRCTLMAHSYHGSTRMEIQVIQPMKMGVRSVKFENMDLTWFGDEKTQSDWNHLWWFHHGFLWKMGQIIGCDMGRGTSRHIPWHQSQLPPAAKEMANLAWSDDNDGVGFGKVHGWWQFWILEHVLNCMV